MNHYFVASAMCEVTEELLWKPRMAWAIKHNPTANLTLRVGSGKKTYLSHRRDTTNNASMTLTYGKMMVVSKSDPDKLCQWLSSREVHDRRYYNGELNLLNVLSHTIAHEFGHFVQVILGRRYEGSVHNPEFYTILDRIHGSGEADKIRAALHQRCMENAIDLRQITASQKGLNALSGLLPSGEKQLSMSDVRRGQELWFLSASMRSVGPVTVKEKRRTKIVVASVANPKDRWLAPPSYFSREPA